MTTRKKRERREKGGVAVSSSDVPKAAVPSSSLAAVEEIRGRILHALQQESPERPATVELVRALLMRYVSLGDAFAQDAPDAFLQLSRAVVENAEIVTWLSVDPIPQPRYNELAPPWLKTGILTIQDVVEVDRAIQSRRAKGRPVTKRVLARLALDEKRKDPTISWARLAMKLKYCEDGASLDVCGGRLQKQVKILERFLARLSSGEKD